jgi:hypothetical protein
MKRAKILMICLGILLGIQDGYAQGTNTLPDFVIKNQQKRDELERLTRQNREESDAANRQRESRSAAESERRKQARKEQEEKTKIEVAEINAKFTPPAEYAEKYADFLNEKNTGIVRMFPDKNCGKGLVVTVQELERCRETPQVTGAGSLYSVKLSEIPDYVLFSSILFYVGQSEIHFTGDKFVVGNDSTLSIISEIGDARLAEINLKSEAFRFLTEYNPAKSKTALTQQTAELEKGIGSGGFLYSNSAKAKLNSVYVLRTVAFRKDERSFWNKDTYVAFKIVGQETDGSIIFVWKRLKEKDAPVLDFDK